MRATRQQQTMMNNQYGFYNNDTMVDNICSQVLSDIDQLMFTDTNNNNNNQPTNNTTSPQQFNHSPIYGSQHSHSSSYNNPHTHIQLPQICSIDKLFMEELPTIPNNHSSHHSPSTDSPIGIQYNHSNIQPYYDINNNNNNNNNVALIRIFQPENKCKLQLKDHIFISKDVTYRLGQYIVKENWSKQCSLLYKYLDYIFRCQCFNQQIIEIYHQKNKKIQYLLWHTGLQRRSDNQFLYLLLVPNSISKIQKWRVQFGNIRNSFLSKHEIISKLKESQIEINESNILPKRTKFSQDLSDLLYDESYVIQANWEERLTTNQDRIFRVMGSLAFFDNNNKYLKLSELIEAFIHALPKTQRIASLNPRLAVPQGFVDTKHCKYRMELLLPIIIRFPKFNGNYYKFVLAIGKSNEKEKIYNVKSILTMDMAYANARLVGYVDSLWLHSSNNGHKKNDKDINEFVLNL